MSEIIAGVHPTRMELLALRKRLKIAERGRDLLREKLDALMIEFFEFIREIANLRARSQELLVKAYEDFILAQAVMGTNNLERTSIGAEDRFVVDAKPKNVIGVTLPYIEVNLRSDLGQNYSLLNTSAKLDDATIRMTAAVKAVVELSGAEAAVRKLAEAIASTKRRVNSLEYVVIPRMLNTTRYIEMYLEEREREDFFRLKRIKKRLESRPG